jgi:hypothetical protein
VWPTCCAGDCISVQWAITVVQQCLRRSGITAAGTGTSDQDSSPDRCCCMSHDTSTPVPRVSMSLCLLPPVQELTQDTFKAPKGVRVCSCWDLAVSFPRSALSSLTA